MARIGNDLSLDSRVDRLVNRSNNKKRSLTILVCTENNGREEKYQLGVLLEVGFGEYAILLLSTHGRSNLIDLACYCIVV